MKKNIIYLITLLSFAITSCSDYLDTEPGDKYDENAVWASPILAESFVQNIYLGIPYPHQWYTSASLVDEAIPFQNDGIMTRVLTSTMTPDDLGAFANNWALCMENWYWASLYNNIRACNVFFQKIEKTEFSDPKKKEQLIGEVHFLRAYFYSMLMMQYGGVIILDKPIQSGDNFQIPRSSLAETIEFILADCDKALEHDKLKDQNDNTHATVGAVMTLKLRVLMYAGGELFNNSSWASGYENPDLISFTDGKRQERLKKAQKVAEDIIALGIYNLYDVDANKSKNFSDLFLQNKSDEQIFVTMYDSQNWPFYGTNWLAWTAGLKSFGGFMLNSVTADLANSFENIDGTPFNWAIQKNDPYTNRDPRFDGTILHDGSSWIRPNTSTWAFDSYTVDFKTGVDSESPTGYAYKKFINPSESGYAYFWGPFPKYPYMQMRYAEVLLNYAEVCLGLGEDDKARNVMNELRQRAGMPDIPTSVAGTDLIKQYQNERRVELALEGHRLFDVRRWMIASEAYKPVSGVKWNGSQFEQKIVEQRAWNNSHYLIPIPRSEIQKNTAIKQNPLYK